VSTTLVSTALAIGHPGSKLGTGRDCQRCGAPGRGQTVRGCPLASIRPYRIERKLAVHHHVTMASFDWLYAALIGIGGSILGGLVVGWYTLRAVHQQWEHDRATARLDRSHQAASAVIAAISELEQAIFAWQKGREDADALLKVHNSFERAALVHSTALTDHHLFVRVSNHQLLAYKFVVAARDEDRRASALSEAVRYHADKVIPALRAQWPCVKPIWCDLRHTTLCDHPKVSSSGVTRCTGAPLLDQAICL
jgi:hypothetical protein